MVPVLGGLLPVIQTSLNEMESDHAADLHVLDGISNKFTI